MIFFALLIHIKLIGFMSFVRFKEWLKIYLRNIYLNIANNAYDNT